MSREYGRYLPVMLQPVELQGVFPVSFDGQATTTAAVWEMLVASRDGDLVRVRELVTRTPVLACCKYNYVPPIHLAARGGHLEVVRFLLAHGGLFPEYGSDPFGDSLITIARNWGHDDVAGLLEDVARNPLLATPCIAPTDAMELDLPGAEARAGFRGLLTARLEGSGSLSEIEDALGVTPGHATDPYQYWGEGVLAVPAQQADFELVSLLIRYGARVPAVSKWCARYYFKRAEMGAFLLANGMSPNHMSWQRVTLLHELAFHGAEDKVRLLLSKGADPNPVDDEYGVTPLAVAVRRGHAGTGAVLREWGGI